jgi:hypothetical protein
MKKVICIAILIAALFGDRPALSQQHTEDDLNLRGSSRVDESTLAVEFQIPLANYPGRGIDVPVSISYSSKVWRLDYSNSQPSVNDPGNCIALNDARYAENSASGWTSSLAVPYIEYVGLDNLFDSSGNPAGSGAAGCASTPAPLDNAWIRRLALHLPGGETHELRMNDTVLVYPPFSNCADDDPDTPCHPSDPSRTGNWNGWYYAADGSNIRYFEDRTNGTFFVQMPDGSRYEFEQSVGSLNQSTVRKVTTLVDRNGNRNDYHAPTEKFPNGYWTDTVGRAIPVPISPTAPAQPGVQEILLPGLGNVPLTYRLHWKRLKGDTPSESALDDFGRSLSFVGDKILENNRWRQRSEGSWLFGSKIDSWVTNGGRLFNPIVLAEVEFPNGLAYGFRYNVYGEIEKVTHPTGGDEQFRMIPVAAASDLDGINAQFNRGAASRTVRERPGTSGYVWTYSAAHVSPTVFKVSVTNPDRTRTERLLHRGRPRTGPGGSFGYDSALSGMAFEETVFRTDNTPFSKTLTNWTRTVIPVSAPSGGLEADWHPRTHSVETIVYDASGNGVSTTTVFGYDEEAALVSPSTPVLLKSRSDFGYVTAGSGIPSAPIRTSESIYLISDPAVDAGRREFYRSRNLVGLVSSVVVRDSVGNTLSRSENRFDEDPTSPVGRGNITSTRTRIDTKGQADDPAAYAVTRSRFDEFGNQIEYQDARGNVTRTEFDPAHRAFPVIVRGAVAEPDGSNGSSSRTVTTAQFDARSGLQLSATSANGVETRFAFDPKTLRLVGSSNHQGGARIGSTSEIEYFDEPGNVRVLNRSQIDDENWSETTTYFDGLGRVVRVAEKRPDGTVFNDREYDEFGRLKRASNPYRTGEHIEWTTSVYDEAGRVKAVILPDGTVISTDWGVLMGDLAAT